MASNVTRDHHNLRRNLRLNDNYLSNDGGDEGIRIDNDGQIGIGTDDPDAPLDIKANVVDFIHLDRTANAGVSTVYKMSVGAGDELSIGRDGVDDNIFMNSSGQVGIGDSSQNKRLAVIDQDRSSEIGLVHNTDGSGVSEGIELGRISFGSDDPYDDKFVYGAAIAGIANGTWQADISVTGNTYAAVDSNPDTITDSGNGFVSAGFLAGMVILVSGSSATANNTSHTIATVSAGTLTLTSTSALTADAAGDSWTIKTTDSPARLAFYTADAGDNILDERMTVIQSGNVGIGVTDPASPLEIFNTSSQLKISYDASNYADISVADDGHLEIATTGTAADFTLDVDGTIHLESTATMQINSNIALIANKVIYFSTADTKIGSNADDPEDMIIEADQDILMSPDNNLDIVAGGEIDFNSAACGFTQLTVTFGASGVIGDIGNSTDVDFRLGNKAWLELTGNLGALNNINLIFPAVSGNFVLVLEQDGIGSRTIHADAWEGNMYTSDGSTTATTANPLWAGGTAPTLTTTADYFDIISFYWDATNGRVFAVPTLNFF